MSTEGLTLLAKKMRHKIIEISYTCNLSTHLGGGLSMVDIMAVLYGKVLKLDVSNPRWADRDRFILSKGHGVLGYFTALWAAGIINEETFQTFQKNESNLIAHPVMNLDLGIESSNGSLGHGLSMGVGIALAAKKKNQDFNVYVYMGDGECNEGSVWEAVMSAAQLDLDNLTAIVDYNKLQSDGDARDIMDLSDLAAKFKAFGWDVKEIDGHDITQIVEAFEAARVPSMPRVLVAHTVKGQGISFMENNNEWHHNRLTKTTYEQALTELGVAQNETGEAACLK
jgi:transketolase